MTNKESARWYYVSQGKSIFRIGWFGTDNDIIAFIYLRSYSIRCIFPTIESGCNLISLSQIRYVANTQIICGMAGIKRDTARIAGYLLSRVWGGFWYPAAKNINSRHISSSRCILFPPACDANYLRHSLTTVRWISPWILH